MDVSSDSDDGGNNNRRKLKEKAAAAATSYAASYPPQTEEERRAVLRAYKEEESKSAREYLPIFLARQAKQPAQLAIAYYKKEEGVQLQLVEMIMASTAVTKLGYVTHLQFKALRLNSSGEPSEEGPPTTFYAQIHQKGHYCCPIKKSHASRVFTPESPLLDDPLFKVNPDHGWVEYPYDCPKCGLDFNKDRERFKNIRPSAWN